MLWKKLGLLIVSLSLMGNTNCATDGTMPDFTHKIYVGSPQDNGIVRRQANEVVRCNADVFRDFVCVSADSYQKIYEGILSCKEW